MNQKIKDLYYSTLAVLVNSGIIEFEHFHDDARVILRVANDNLFTFNEYSEDKLNQNIKEFEENYVVDNAKSSIRDKFHFIYCSGNHMSLNNLDILALNPEALILKHTLQLNQNRPEIFQLLIDDIKEINNLLLTNMTYMNKFFPDLKVFEKLINHPDLTKLFLYNRYYDDKSVEFIEKFTKLKNNTLDLFVHNILNKSSDIEKMALPFFFSFNLTDNLDYNDRLEKETFPLISQISDIDPNLLKKIDNHYFVDFSDICQSFSFTFPNEIISSIFENDELADICPANLITKINGIDFKISFTATDKNLCAMIETDFNDNDLIKLSLSKYIPKFIKNNISPSCYQFIKKENLFLINSFKNEMFFEETLQEIRNNSLTEKLNSSDTNEYDRKKPKI